MRKLSLLTLVLFFQACAFTDAQLDVAHSPDANFNGPIGTSTSQQFSKVSLEDGREDMERIGWKKNGYGQNTADITSSNPVELILANAIEAGLLANGHKIVDSESRVAIEGTVDKFWFDTDMNFWTVEFTGDIQCTLTFTDISSGAQIYTSSYSGTHSEKVAGGLEKTWTNVLNQAVDKMIEDLVFDEDLAEILDSLD